MWRRRRRRRRERERESLGFGKEEKTSCGGEIKRVLKRKKRVISEREIEKCVFSVRERERESLGFGKEEKTSCGGEIEREFWKGRKE